jgi:rare lipoprotein A
MSCRFVALVAAIVLSIGAIVPELRAAERGIASVYPTSYKGRRTASGKPLDPSAMTCAHRQYPFGSTLRVTAGEKSVTCQVTDRGPFVRGRIVDITPVAARALGISGLARVSVERQ